MGAIAIVKRPSLVLVIKAISFPGFWKSRDRPQVYPSEPTHTSWGRPANQFPLRTIGGSISVQPSTVLEAGAGVPAMTALTQDEGPVNDPFYEEERTPEGKRLTPEQIRADKGSYDPSDPVRAPEPRPPEKVLVTQQQRYEGSKMTQLRDKLGSTQKKFSNAQRDTQRTLMSMLQVMDKAEMEGRIQNDRETGQRYIMARDGRKNIEPNSGLTVDMNRKLSSKRKVEQKHGRRLKNLKVKFNKAMDQILTYPS